MRTLSLIAGAAVSVLVCSMLFVQAAPVTAQTEDQKNIVFVLTDDQPISTIKYMGNLDSAIRQEGKRLDNAYAVNTLCCTNRSTIYTGKYMHNHRVFSNELDRGGGYEKFVNRGHHLNTYAKWLDDAGYRTGHFGKVMNGFYEEPRPAGWDEFGGPYEDVGTPDADKAARGVRFIEENSGDEPFLLTMSFSAPHAPTQPDNKYENDYPNLRAPRDGNFDEADVRDKPRYVKRRSRLTESEKSDLDALYRDQVRSLQTVDEFIGDAKEELQRQGEWEDTYFVYYTDHGLKVGDHRFVGQYRKGRPSGTKLSPYEADSGFPMFVRGPGIEPDTTTERLAGSHDIAPTFAEIAGVESPGVDGTSLLPILDSDVQREEWRTALYGERTLTGELPDESSNQGVPSWESVRNENRVYTRYKNDPYTPRFDAGFKEFYDFRADPQQLRNSVYYDTVSRQTLDYMQQRLLRFRGCKGEECRRAEGF